MDGIEIQLGISDAPSHGFGMVAMVVRVVMMVRVMVMAHVAAAATSRRARAHIKVVFPFTLRHHAMMEMLVAFPLVGPTAGVAKVVQVAARGEIEGGNIDFQPVTSTPIPGRSRLRLVKEGFPRRASHWLGAFVDGPNPFADELDELAVTSPGAKQGQEQRHKPDKEAAPVLASETLEKERSRCCSRREWTGTAAGVGADAGGGPHAAGAVTDQRRKLLHFVVASALFRRGVINCNWIS